MPFLTGIFAQEVRGYLAYVSVYDRVVSQHACLCGRFGQSCLGRACTSDLAAPRADRSRVVKKYGERRNSPAQVTIGAAMLASSGLAANGVAWPVRTVPLWIEVLRPQVGRAVSALWHRSGVSIFMNRANVEKNLTLGLLGESSALEKYERSLGRLSRAVVTNLSEGAATCASHLRVCQPE
jgi:hypothetical protein